MKYKYRICHADNPDKEDRNKVIDKKQKINLNLMKKVFNLKWTLPFVVVLFSLISCVEKSNHDFLLVSEDTGHVAHKIKLNSEYVSPFYEIEFKCLNKNSFSPDSFEFISYKKIEITDYDNLLVSRSKNGSNLDGISLQNGNNTIHYLSFPNDSKSKTTAIKSTKSLIKSPYNELLRIDYQLGSNSNQKHVKILGYSNSPLTESKSFDWNYFLSDKRNLYNFYKIDPSNQYKWKTKF